MQQEPQPSSPQEALGNSTPGTLPGNASQLGQRRRHWWPFVLPLLVYTGFGAWEPQPAGEGSQPGASSATPAEQESWSYPRFYAWRVGLTIAALVMAAPAYRSLPWRLHPQAVVVGVMGAALWIGLRLPRWEERLWAFLDQAGLASLGARAAFDPYAAFSGDAGKLAMFLALRFTGLVIVAPLIEEIFLRGFFLRWIRRERWWEAPFGEVTVGVALAAAAYGALAHPGEWLAAVVWFTLLTWLMHNTRSLGDCVLAHVVTNLLLGVYILATQAWWLW